MEIIIDSVTFTLIKTIDNGQYNLVQIQSKIKKNGYDKINIFYVYPSGSELGIWRLCSYNGKYIYKGSDISKPNYIYDYVQSTLIHVRLQLFINYHIKNRNEILFPSTENLNLYPSYTELGYEDIISSPLRQLHLPPFIRFQKIIQCGELESPYVGRVELMFGPNISNHPSSLISVFSHHLSEKYSIDFSSIVKEGPYSNTFQGIIQIVGVVKSVILYNSEHRVKLYFLQVKCIENIHEKVKSKLTPEMITNIHKVCALPVHFMPFLLTTPDSTCNEFGLYNTYIPSGAFICKLFDYSTETMIQCSKDEIVCGQVTPWYTYIGSRYSGIFPFVQLMEYDKPPKLKMLDTLVNRIKHDRGGKLKTKNKKNRNNRKFYYTRNRKVKSYLKKYIV
jgi:hypothetical protein